MKKFIAILILISLILSGCTEITKLTDNLKNKVSNSEAIEDDDKNQEFENFDIENVEVEIVTGEYEVESSIERTIGNMNFTTKNKEKVEFEYIPNLEGQEVKLVDNNGWEWTFSFPQYALTRTTLITFTPIAEAKIDSLPDAEITGFLIEPDGLSFINYPKVTIKNQGQGLDGYLLSSNHDGSGVNIQPSFLENGEIQGNIPHFSVWALIADKILNKKSIEEIKEITEEQCKKAEKLAEEFLKKPLTIPEPPNIGMECFNDEKKEQANAYAKLVCKEEAEIVKALLAAMRSYHDAGGDVYEKFELARKVVERAIAKVNKLYRTYKNDPEKFIPVLYATILVYKEYSLLGGVSPDLSDFIPWIDRTKKYYMDRLVKEHDYKASAAVGELLRLTSVFGGVPDIEEWYNALAFKLKLKIEFMEEWEDGYDMITSEGEGEMILQKISTEDLWKSKNVFLKGELKIKSKLSGEYYSNMKYTADNYTIAVEIRNWDPCKTQSCDIWVSNLGLDDEQIGYYDEGEFVVFSEVLISSYSYDNFDEELENGFNVKINNLSENAVKQTFSGEDAVFGGVKLDILFDLTHTPKR